MKKFFYFTAIIMAMLLMGCGTKNKNEEEIIQDIIATSEVFQKYNDLEVVEFTIDRRATDREEKTDEIHFLLKSESENLSYDLQGVIGYYCYDQGWQVVDFAETGYKLTPKNSTITEEMAEEKVRLLFGNDDSWNIYLDKRETNLESGEDIFSYVVTSDSKSYWTTGYGVDIIYCFDLKEGWIYEDFETYSLEGSWNEDALLGTWYTDLAGLSGYFKMTIKDVDEESGVITADYTCDIVHIALTQPLQKEGSIMFTADNQWTYVMHRGTLTTIRIELDKYRGVVFDGYYCEKIE